MATTAVMLLGIAVLAGAEARVGAVAQPVQAEDSTTETEAMRAVYASFDGIRIADALVAQPARIAAAVAALPAHPAGAETLVLAIGGQGYQAIFDREARAAAAVLTARTPGPALVLSNTARQVATGIVASPATVAQAIAAIGRRARPGDTIIVYMTSHGGPDASIAMDAPFLDFAPLTAADLAGALDGAGLSRRIVIISACYAASWIDALASPTTIVLTAAAADRTSFGCDDRRKLTVFGEAVLGELGRTDQSLAATFDRAKARIAAVERAEQITPSLPEARVGSAMQAVWTGRQ